MIAWLAPAAFAVAALAWWLWLVREERRERELEAEAARRAEALRRLSTKLVPEVVAFRAAFEGMARAVAATRRSLEAFEAAWAGLARETRGPVRLLVEAMREERRGVASTDRTPPDPGPIELEEVWEAPGLAFIAGVPALLLMVVVSALIVRVLW